MDYFTYVFASLVESYVKTVRDSGVPDVDDAVTAVSKIENDRLSTHIIKRFRTKLDNIKLPQLNTKAFDEQYLEYKEEMLSMFRKEAMFNPETFERKIIQEIDTFLKEKNEENFKLVKEQCKLELGALYLEVVGTPEIFHKPGGHAEYRNKLMKLKRDYKSKMSEVDEHSSQKVLNDFMDKEAETESTIMMADMQLTSDYRQKEIDQIRQQNVENDKKWQKKFNLALEKQNRLWQNHTTKMEQERQKSEQERDEKYNQLREDCMLKIQIAETEMRSMKSQSKDEVNKLIEEIRLLKNKSESDRKRWEKKSKDEMDLRMELQSAITKLETKTSCSIL